MSNTQTPQRNQHIIEHIKDAWGDLQQPTPEKIVRILDSLRTLPEQDAKVGLETIATYLTNTMAVHLFDLLAIFQEKAEQEGFSAADREEILNDVLPDVIKLVQELKEHVTANSIEALAILANTTIGLQMLSTTDSADDAHSWLYELPSICHGQLSERKLLISTQASCSKVQQLAPTES